MCPNQERLLLTPEDRGSNTLLNKIYIKYLLPVNWIEKTKIKIKGPVIAYKCSYLTYLDEHFSDAASVQISIGTLFSFLSLSLSRDAATFFFVPYYCRNYSHIVAKCHLYDNEICETGTGSEMEQTSARVIKWGILKWGKSTMEREWKLSLNLKRKLVYNKRFPLIQFKSAQCRVRIFFQSIIKRSDFR